MKKRILALVTICTLLISSCLCVSAADATISDAPVALASSADDFTLLDLTADMVDAGMYAENDTVELVLTLFTLDKDQYVSLMIYDNADGSSDVFCGKLTDKNTKVSNNSSLTKLTNVQDVYTDSTFSLTVDERGKTSYIIAPDGTKYTATALTADETIDYMTAVINLVQ